MESISYNQTAEKNVLLLIQSATSLWDILLVGSGLLESLSLFSMQIYVYKYREERQYSFHHPRVLRKKKNHSSVLAWELERVFFLASLDIVKKSIL